MILNIALGILLAVFILPLILVIVKIFIDLFEVIATIVGIILILALVAGLFYVTTDNLKLAGGILFLFFYCIVIGYLSKGLPLLEKLSDGVDHISFRSGDWKNFLRERVRNHGRRGFILGFLSLIILIICAENSQTDTVIGLTIFLFLILIALVFRVIKIEIALEELPSEIQETNSQIEFATNLKEKALVLVKEKKFDFLVINLRNALEKKLIPKVGDPPGELEVKRYLVGELDLFVKKGEIDHWSRFDICIGFDRSNFPEFCVSIDVHIGAISVEQLHYSFEFQKKMDKLSFFLNSVIEQDKLKQMELEVKSKIKLAEEESRKFKGL